MARTPVSAPADEAPIGVIVTALRRIDHDGVAYDAGAALPPMPEPQAEALILAGAAAPADATPPTA